MHWLSFGLSKEQEEHYRRANLAADSAQGRLCLQLALVPLVVLWFNDLALNPLAGRLYALTALRFALLVGGLLLIRHIGRVQDPASYDKAVAVGGLGVAVYMSIVAATRPAAYQGHVVIAVIACFIALLVVPNRFGFQVAVSWAMAFGELLATPFQELSLETGLVTVFSLILVNVIGATASAQLHIHRRRAFLAQQEREEALRLTQGVLDQIPIPVFYKDHRRAYLGCNQSYEAFMKRERSQIVGKTARDIAPGRQADLYDEQDTQLLGQPGVQVYESELAIEGQDSPAIRRVRFHKATFSLPDHRTGIVGALLDVTEQRALEEQREKLIAELREALANVKSLSGLLPICMYCHKIRDDKGYWNRVETYIREHSEAEFSHGLCPDCLEERFPEPKDE